ncbi:MAG: DUF3999 family protein [Bacillota bacterium]
MQKKYKLLVLTLSLALLITGLAQTASANAALKSWSYYKEITTEGKDKYKYFYADNDIYSQSSQDLSDLRITDGKGNIIPYYLVNGWSGKTKKNTFYNSEVTARVNADNDTITDFKVIPLYKNEDISGNAVLLSLPRGDFYRNIEIYGSYDGKRWDHIRNDRIYSVEGIEKNKIDLGGAKKYGYYRIKLLDNLDYIYIDGLKLEHCAVETQFNTFQKTASLPYEINSSNGYTTITLHNEDKLRVKSITLDTEGNFKRQFEVNIKESDFPTRIFTGEIYNLQFRDLNVSQTNIDFSGRPISANQFFVKINDRDDRPLKIKSIMIEYYVDKVVFEESDSPPYRVYFGNPQATKPGYEIELLKEHVEKEKQNLCQLGAAITNSQEETRQPPFKLEYVFNTVVGIVSLLLVIMLARKLNAKY